MTLPLQDHTTEAARRDSGTTKHGLIDDASSSKYIKWLDVRCFREKVTLG